MKIRKTLKSVVALTCAIALMLTLSVGANADSVELTGEEYIKIATDGSLELYVKPSTTGFKVVDTASGESWQSCVDSPQNDPYVGGIYITEMQSLVSVDYYDKDGVLNTVNSFASSVLNDTYSLKAIKNGYRVEYNIEDGLVKLALEIKLEGGALCVDVFTSKIKIAESYSVSDISVLPFFMSGSAEDNGYLFIPDGCGGIVSFDSDKQGIAEYSRPVYGESISDDGIELSDLNNPTDITLPVFGVKKNNGAVFCLLDKGESMASIEAYGAKRVSSLYNVYSSYGLYSNMEYTFSASTVTIFEDAGIKLSDISQKYFFLSGNDADYNGMAKTLRNLLLEDGVLESSKTELAPFITVYGGISVKKSVFGFLTDSVEPLTTTGQLTEIVEKAKELGIDKPVVNYVSWNKQELKGKPVSNLKLASKLKKGVSFNELCESEDFTFVPTVSNVFSYTKSSNIISKFSSPASSIAGTALFKKPLSQTSFKEYGKRNYFLNKKYINKNLDKLVSSAKKSKSEYIGLDDVSGMLYEDFGKDAMKRYQMQSIVSESLEKLACDKKLVLSAPNYYCLGLADMITNLPTTTSGHMLIDTEIPFIQLVISGCIGYSSEPLNNIDSSVALLKLIETGSMPHYYMYYAEESTVKNTAYSHLGSGAYEKNLKSLNGLYKELGKVYEYIKGEMLVSHTQVSKDVYRVSYSNGTNVYVNYSDKEYTLQNGSTVSAMGYEVEVAE